MSILSLGAFITVGVLLFFVRPRPISYLRLRLSKDPLDVLALMIYKSMFKDGWRLTENHGSYVIQRDEVIVYFNDKWINAVCVNDNRYEMNSYADRVLFLGALAVRKSIRYKEATQAFNRLRDRACTDIERLKR